MDRKPYSRGSRILQASQLAAKKKRGSAESILQILERNKASSNSDSDVGSKNGLDEWESPGRNMSSFGTNFNRKSYAKENSPVFNKNAKRFTDSDDDPTPLSNAKLLKSSVARDFENSSDVLKTVHFSRSTERSFSIKHQPRRLMYSAADIKKQEDFTELEIVGSPRESTLDVSRRIPITSFSSSTPLFKPKVDCAKITAAFFGNERSKLSTDRQEFSIIRPKPISPRISSTNAYYTSTPTQCSYQQYAYLGLMNISSSCYMNAALQVLLSVPEFRELLKAIGCYLKDDILPEDNLVRRILEIIKCREDRRRISRECLQELCTSAGKQFNTYQQADSHEFLVAVLHQIKHFSEKNAVPASPCNIFEFVRTDIITNKRYDSETVTSSTNSCVLLSVNDCLAGPERSLFDGVTNSMRSKRTPCLAFSSQLEEFAATLTYKLDKFPEVLVINLSRTERHDNVTRKSEEEIHVPDMFILGGTEPFLSLEPTSFHLIAFIVHKGSSSERGHYVSWISTGKDWVCCNDDTITLDDFKSSNVNKEGCVFLYERREL